MKARHKNLLEAFRAAAPEGRAAAERKTAPPAAPGGPFADGARGVRLDEFGTRRRPFVARLLADRTVQGVLVLCLVAIGVAWLIGRGKTDVEAAPTPGNAAAGEAPGGFLRAEDTAPKPTPPADLARKNEQAANLGTVDDQAFHDLANGYTVRVAQYKNDETGLKLARAAVAYIRKEGYPAVQPIRTGDGSAILVCVGAKPKAKDLETLVDFLEDLPGPAPRAKKPPFQGAYVISIDSVLKRR
jgi:hypothetical protein